ncbi:hypothetical protein E2562_011961 [Oryza meyeriana var. granulata]|uniref:Protein FAR1-RELATED SEQUENCE n=1 Tax=Oryza meyeriana var. granulata TaxID=110450 RepID=A0A6G1F746_9ORYZ|nr:hypothetical protein E2562_011961 [Oryza meyeriana var. granulata]
MECKDIPCSHIFAVLKFLGLDTIPCCCVMVRWTMEAKAAFRSDTNSDPHVWSEHMVRYCKLRKMGSDALFAAARNPEQMQKGVLTLDLWNVWVYACHEIFHQAASST